MFENLAEWVEKTIRWTNENQGFLTLIIFVLALLFGWITGIFRKLMFKPRLFVRTIPGPTMCCTYDTDRLYNNHPVKRTSISAYLKISNRGNAPSSIARVRLGIRTYSFPNPFHITWLDQTNVLASFMHDIGDSVKIYPLLFQIDSITSRMSDDYLHPSQMTTGVVYFELDDSWGGHHPRTQSYDTCLVTKVKLSIEDGYGHMHNSWHDIPVVELEYARKYNKEFGNTLEALRYGKNKALDNNGMNQPKGHTDEPGKP